MDEKLKLETEASQTPDELANQQVPPTPQPATPEQLAATQPATQPAAPVYQQPVPQYQQKTVQMPPVGAPNALLKVASVLFIIGAALDLLLAVLLFIAAGLSGSASYSDNQAIVEAFTSVGIPLSGAGMFVAAVLIVLGVIFLVAGIFQLLVGIFGLRGKYVPGMVLDIIFLAFGVLGVIIEIASLASGNGSTQTIGAQLVGLVIPILYLVGVITSQRS